MSIEVNTKFLRLDVKKEADKVDNLDPVRNALSDITTFPVKTDPLRASVFTETSTHEYRLAKTPEGEVVLQRCYISSNGVTSHYSWVSLPVVQL